jgi:ferredoxin
MRVRVDLDKCQGYGNCLGPAPDVFDLNDQGLVLLLTDEPTDDRAAAVREAAGLCPVQAISLED